MNKLWQDEAWEDYLFWQTPEPLRGSQSGWWSRRIDDSNRLVYRINNGIIEIAQCRSHYGDH